MRLTPLAYALTLAGLSAGLISPAQADFIQDGKASLELRNFYLNRDYRQDDPARLPKVTGKKPVEYRSKAEEWAQGFIFRYESGFTEGTVGFGVDALAGLGVKLDGGRGTSGTGLLPADRETGAPQDSYGKLSATAKVKVSKSVLKVGTLTPKLPVAVSSDSRLLPQSFQGGSINSAEIAGLTLDAGRLERINLKDSSDYEPMTLIGGAARGFTGVKGVQSGRFDFAGGTYKWNDQLATGYYYGQLDNFYKQHQATVLHTLPIAQGQSLVSDIRYARSLDDGHTNVDNQSLGALITYKLGYHAFGAGYQKMSGDTGFAYINGTDPFLVNYIMLTDFANKDEKSWQVRYDYDFAGLGIPGLTLMTRYANGDNISLANQHNGKEWERDTDLAYTIQNGPLKGLGLKWRNATVRSNFGNDLDENRLIASYTLPLW